MGGGYCRGNVAWEGREKESMEGRLTEAIRAGSLRLHCTYTMRYGGLRFSMISRMSYFRSSDIDWHIPKRIKRLDMHSLRRTWANANVQGIKGYS